MSNPTSDDELKLLSDAITVTNGCLSTGKTGYTKLSDGLRAIDGVGALVKKVADSQNSSPAMSGKLVELNEKIGQLSDVMSRHYDDLKSLMADHSFYSDIARTTPTLTRLLQDTIAHPVPDSVNIFQAAVFRTPPLQTAYDVISLVRQDSTNPLKRAMEDDKLKRTATFEKCETLIYGVLTHLLYLETYLNGMFWQNNMYGPNRLKDRIEALEGELNEWRNSFKESYWPSAVWKIVKDTQKQHRHSDNDQKCVLIKEALMEILTDDVFYILVYNECSGAENHAFSGRHEQWIYSFREGGCNVVVYRSRHWRGSPKSALDTIKNEVEACRNSLPYQEKYDQVATDLLHNRFSSAGFVGMVKKDHNLAIRSANSFGRGWGPGWWITARMVDLKQSDSPQKEYILVAGYI